MTQNRNKQFNTYKEGLDLEFLREYCMEHGERRTFERGETLEEAGEPAQWGGLRGAGLLQVHGTQRRGGQGLLHGLRLRERTAMVIKY